MSMMDGAESVRSVRSERSERSHRSHSNSNHHHHHRPLPHQHPPTSAYQPSQHRSAPATRTHSNRSSSRDRVDRDRERDDRSVTIKTPAQGDSDIESRNMEERIEVQVIPQDDNWGDNTTAITGNTSETGFSMEDMQKFAVPKDFSQGLGFNCVRFLSTALAVVLSLTAFLSPIAMVILPKPKSTMPRIFVFRAVVLFLVFVLIFAFWLFYGVRILGKQEQEYVAIVRFADSLLDGLLFIHYLALVLLEVRQLQPHFVIRVVRSPDGETRCYSLGLLSVQRAAVAVLEHYYRDFPAYNPYLAHIGRRPGKQHMTGFKVYDVDGNAPNQSVSQGRSRAMFAAAARHRDSSHNDRFYDEQEHERRVRKRRARLLVAAEEAFTHIKRMQEEQGPAIAMDPQEAAQAVFPSMARALQKYLRVTRQQPRYTMDSVLSHLATCISHDLAPRAFVARYLGQGPVILSEREDNKVGRWVLVCEQNVVRELECGMEFQLRSGEVSLMCFVKKLPHFSLTEEVIDPKTNKFVLRLNSETSV
ncbi:hypothetical protein C0Q70_12736 [Pomacea canaliculata]|uniref:Vang-like protein n=1 Tax=Pomacea canaliculata TaxID=400727 RepID=A0A2T7P2D6_POMCA|nr:hypothetical protein C0Q70_12736 [Pomacea canaliculata]